LGKSPGCSLSGAQVSTIWAFRLEVLVYCSTSPQRYEDFWMKDGFTCVDGLSEPSLRIASPEWITRMKLESAKLPYKKPELTIYGDLRQVTQTAGNMGKADSGMSPMHKTSS
jgi:hypothetical protein